jgi:hypothetical protein
VTNSIRKTLLWREGKGNHSTQSESQLGILEYIGNIMKVGILLEVGGAGGSIIEEIFPSLPPLLPPIPNSGKHLSIPRPTYL